MKCYSSTLQSIIHRIHITFLYEAIKAIYKFSIILDYSGVKRSFEVTYGLVVDPKGHPGYNDNHEARNVNGNDKEGQLASKRKHHA